MIKIMLAVEPLLYRKVVGEALRQSWPDLEIVVEDAANLEHALRCFQPQLTVCSNATPLVKRLSPAWIELYPESEPYAIVRSIHGISTINDFTLDALLKIVDETARLLEQHNQSTDH